MIMNMWTECKKPQKPESRGVIVNSIWEHSNATSAVEYCFYRIVWCCHLSTLDEIVVHVHLSPKSYVEEYPKAASILAVKQRDRNALSCQSFILGQNEFELCKWSDSRNI